MRYRVLVVDLEDDTVLPQCLRKIVELARAGATVVLGQRVPRRAPGLTQYPGCDEEVRRLGERIVGRSRKPSPRGGAWAAAGCSAASRWTTRWRPPAILPDFAAQEAPSVRYIHRCDGETDIYFVAGSGKAECTFRVHGKEPELWDPQTGGIRDAVCYRSTADGRTVVPIDFPPNGSTFVVFRRPALPRHLLSVTVPGDDSQSGSEPAGQAKPVAGQGTEPVEIVGRSPNGVRLHVWKAGRYVLETDSRKSLTIAAKPPAEPLSVAGPWEVRFAPGWGAPESIVFDKLIAWDQHPHSGIKYFSGKATYRNAFTLNDSQLRGLVRLQLGEVRHVAQVRVNGRELGVVWTAPWTVDVTGAVKAGRNELEIDVVNLWVNRLIGDAGLPAEPAADEDQHPAAGRPAGLQTLSRLRQHRPAGALGSVGPRAVAVRRAARGGPAVATAAETTSVFVHTDSSSP